jgi:glycosyltransferase involved in cell wall biosynthesis
MQDLPGIFGHHQAYMPLYPAAFATTNLSEFDLVLSNKSGFCHGVVTDDGRHHARHVCYCLTPTRFLWLFEQYRERENIDSLTSAALQPLLALLRQWDYAAAQRVDEFIAISATVQERIREIYHRESVVIHPPVDTEYFSPAGIPAGDYFLIVSRLIPYKRIDLAVDAFAHLPNKQLVIVGDGRDFAELRARATANVHFLGRQPRVVVRDLLQRCAAFLFPGLEDFGIAPVESMACGRPVIAFAGGGALDTVVPGHTGELFTVQNKHALIAALQEFDPTRYDPAAIRIHAQAFSNEAFRTKLIDYLLGERTLTQR